MQILVFAQGLYDVPGEAIHVDPPALDPGRLWLADKLDQSRIIQLMDLEVLLGEVNNGNLTIGMEVRGGILPAIRFLGVDARFRARVPAWMSFVFLELLNSSECVGSCVASSSG